MPETALSHTNFTDLWFDYLSSLKYTNTLKYKCIYIFCYRLRNYIRTLSITFTARVWESGVDSVIRKNINSDLKLLSH